MKKIIAAVAVLSLGSVAYAGDFRQASAASTLFASQNANAREVERELEKPYALTGDHEKKHVRRQPFGNRGVHSFQIGRGWDQ